MNIGVEASIALRILFSYFVNGDKNSFTRFIYKVGKENTKELRLFPVLNTIYESRRNRDKSIKNIAIIVCIDEVNKSYDKNTLLLAQ